MRPKKSKEPKKYAVGGMIAGAALGLGQAGLGAYQMFQGQQAAKRIKEASTARPSEYAELLKQARNAELEQRRLEELNRAISTGISAAQQGGGRALVGALPGMVRAGDAGALDILGQRQAQTMQALQFAAQGSEREIGRELQREMMERQAAQAALEGGLQNIAGGVSQLGSAAVLGLQGAKSKTGMVEPAAPTLADAAATAPVSDTESILSGIAEEERLKRQESILAEEDFMIEPGFGTSGPSKRGFMKEGGMVTGGKFDHKTNPIDIVRQGKKIGEMTGGEVILNPQQQKKLSKESAYFRQLLKKFNKQK
jgi:hypothetical protein